MSICVEVAVRRPAVVVDPEQCKGCRRCVKACPKSVLVLSERTNSHGYLSVRAKDEGCTGCGLCFYACPEPGAITVYRKTPDEAN